jgi:hypothetical protein
MAKTQIADVIVPEVFNPYVVNRTAELSALFQSGIVGRVSEIDGSLNEGNRTVNMPFWNDLDGNDEVLSDSAALTPDKIGSNKDVATQLFRGRAWSANDLAATMSGDDPMGAIGDLVASYWTRRMQASLVSTLKGVFNGPLNATHVNSIAAEDTANVTDATKISGDAIVDTVSKLGDAHSQLTAIVMHSVPYFNLVKQNLIVYEKDATGQINIPTYLGKRVIVDDGAPVTAGTGASPSTKYTSYLFGASAIGYGEGNPEVPTETDRDSLAGDDILVTRKHFVLHPRGVKFADAVVAGSSPSNTELEDTTNWAKVYEDKQIRMVALTTNG